MAVKTMNYFFTVPLTDHDKVSEMKGVKVIGHITKPDLGNYLVGRDGGEVELKAQGLEFFGRVKISKKVALTSLQDSKRFISFCT